MAMTDTGERRTTIEIEREEDGRWIAEVMEWPGVLVYGATREEAVEALGLSESRVPTIDLPHSAETTRRPLLRRLALLPSWS